MYKYFLHSAVLALLAFQLNAQDKAASAQYAQKLEEYLGYKPQVKVFLHTDKPYYVAGDTLWFAAYGVAGPEQIPDSVTGVVYVDLFRIDGDKIIEQQKIALNQGRGAGQIVLPDSLQHGEYGLRAYSQYMRNFSEDAFFQRRIHIYDPKRLEETLSVTPSNHLADCQFFPESGVFLAGVNNKVAFKAINAKGKGLDVQGVVLTEKGDTVTSFKSEYLGMGVCPIKPQAGTRYIARVTDGTETKQYNLPRVQEEGYTFSINNLGKSPNVRMVISCTKPEPGKQLSVLVHARGRGLFAVDIESKLPEQLLNIPRNIFAPGLNSVTLFDPNGRPVCERLVFQWKDEALRLSIEPDKQQYAPKGMVTLNLSAKDASGKPVKGHFSMAVTDGGQVLQDSLSDHLLSYLMLSSDIRGQIEAPAQYFNPKNIKAPIYLDWLLMTQGWRHYDWNTILGNDNTAPLAFPLESALFLKGFVNKTNGKSLKSSADLSMILSDPYQEQIINCTTNEYGAFESEGLFFQDSARLMINLPDKLDPESHQITLTPTAPALANGQNVPAAQWAMSESQFKEMLDQSAEWQMFLKRRAALNDVMLAGVDIKAKKKETEKRTDPRRGIFGRPSNTIEVKDYMRNGIINPLQMLQGRASGVQVTCVGGNCTVVIRAITTFSGDNEPMYMIDGIQTSKESLQALSAYDIHEIDIIKPNAILGSRGAGGAINFITKRETDSPGLPGSVKVFQIAGYKSVKKFYVPRYDLIDSPERSLPDYRSVVFWNADVTTDANGKAVVKFFTSDAPNTFKVNVQGMGESGQLGIGNGQYMVR